jgi:hypothetical protein
MTQLASALRAWEYRITDVPTTRAHWIVFSHNENATKSFPKNIWGMNSRNSNGRVFLGISKNPILKAQPGDILWFVLSKTHGRVLFVATYTGSRLRIRDETLTNGDLGWVDTGFGQWDYQVEYENSIKCNNISLDIGSTDPRSIRRNPPNNNFDELYNGIINGTE